jgi:branched-chain amino acid aminotransferase
LWSNVGVLDDEALVWVNGELAPARSATVGVADHGLVVGDAAFETLQIIRGVPFAMTRHIRRLYTTLAALAVVAPGEETLRDAMAQVVAANGLQTGRLRLTVTAGPGPLGSSEPRGPATVIAAAEPLGEPPNHRMVMVPWTRNERGALAGLKTTSYAENVRALRLAHERGAGEALFTNTQGLLCEGTGTNLFVVTDTGVFTPPLASGCLAGVTRELVLELADVDETDLPVEILDQAGEVFITSSTRDVHHIEEVDDRIYAAQGPVTASIASAFADLLATDLDP